LFKTDPHKEERRHEDRVTDETLLGENFPQRQRDYRLRRRPEGYLESDKKVLDVTRS